MMTKQHFEAIAEVLRETKPATGVLKPSLERRAQWERTVAEFVRMGKRENARFDQDRFARACGVES